MYAILDIETTGGKYNEEGITEIAIYKFDGNEVVDQFSSLINPERPIQPFVVNLTGINNKMLRQAPKFYEVAARIVEITENCVIVAHNASFDNRILATEFDRLGYPFEKEMLCTVELAKKLLPDMPSYSLGNLVKSLGIPLSDRHRAQGDAKATVALFTMLLAKDSSKEIIAETLRKESKPKLAGKFFDMVEPIPSETGVYYMHDTQGKVIYIGRGKNIRKKVLQHFTNDNRKSKRLQLDVASVSYEKTGNELISMLKEYEEIKRIKPKYNRVPGSFNYTHQLVSSVDQKGFITLHIAKSSGKQNSISFSSFQQAKMTLAKLVEDYNLCPGLCDLEEYSNEGSSLPTDVQEYNENVLNVLSKIRLDDKNMLLIDRGRSIDEHSVIWIENGVYKGFAFYNLNHQINQIEILRSIINPPNHPRDSQHIVQNYLRRNKKMKIINLSTDSVT